MFIIGIVVSAVITIPIYYAMSGGWNTRDFGETVLMQVKVFGGLLMAVGFGAIGFLTITLK